MPIQVDNTHIGNVKNYQLQSKVLDVIFFLESVRLLYHKIVNREFLYCYKSCPRVFSSECNNELEEVWSRLPPPQVITLL